MCDFPTIELARSSWQGDSAKAGASSFQRCQTSSGRDQPSGRLVTVAHHRFQMPTFLNSTVQEPSTSRRLPAAQAYLAPTVLPSAFVELSASLSSITALDMPSVQSPLSDDAAHLQSVAPPTDGELFVSEPHHCLAH